MPFRHIYRLKTRVLWLLDTGFLPKEIAYILGVSDRSIRRWVANEAELGDVIPPQNPRSHTHGGPDTCCVIETVSAGPEMFLDEVRDYLALEHDTLVPYLFRWPLLQASPPSGPWTGWNGTDSVVAAIWEMVVSMEAAVHCRSLCRNTTKEQRKWMLNVGAGIHGRFLETKKNPPRTRFSEKDVIGSAAVLVLTSQKYMSGTDPC